MKNKAQSILEYAVLIIVVVAALLAMQAYFKRGIQGRARSSADEISGGSMYAPGETTAHSTVTRSITEGMKSYTETTTTGEKNVSENTFEMNQQTSRQDTIPPPAAGTGGSKNE
jgi:uncharacterized protein (UPF0333 family)